MPSTLAPTAESTGSLLEIRIDFERGTTDPGRVFRAMARTIDAVASLEEGLAASIATNIRPEIILQDIQARSLVAIIRSIMRVVDGEPLGTTWWEAATGRYVERSVIAVLRFIEGRDTIRNIDETEELILQLEIIAQETGAALPVHSAPIRPSKLVKDIGELTSAVKELGPADAISVSSSSGVVPINTRFFLPPERVEELLTREVLSQQLVLRLVVKRPDYLGNSMWQFRYQDHVIDARILDLPWLQEFQSGRVALWPGDALRAETKVEVKLGKNREIIARNYSVIRVLGVDRDSRQRQPDLPLTGTDRSR
ncbi:hypothetical protein BH24GEM3_BH24GEM3_05340 [soil metagenome]